MPAPRIQRQAREIVEQRLAVRVEDEVRVHEALIDVQRLAPAVPVDPRRLDVDPQLIVPQERAQELVLDRDHVDEAGDEA